MSILRTTARTSLVKARLAYYAGINRSTSTSSAALKEGGLPLRDWGKPPPAREWGKPPAARDWGSPPADQQRRRRGGPNDRPNDRQQGDRDAQSPRRGQGSYDKSFANRSDDGRRNNRDRRQPSGPNASSGPGLPKGKWDLGGGPRASRTTNTNQSTSAVVRNAAPASDTDAPRYDADGVIMFRSEDEGRHGRAKPNHNRHGRESRSLLLEIGGELEIPGPDHHRSLKGKGKKKETRDRDRDRREFVVEDEDEEEMMAHLKRLEEERAAKQSARQKAEAAKAKQRREQMEKEVFIPPNVTVAQLADKCNVSLRRMQSTMRKIGMADDQMRADFFLNSDQAFELALELNLEPVIDSDRGFDLYPE